MRTATKYGQKKKNQELRNPQLWLPPKSVLERVTDIISLHFQYLLTVGKHSSGLPNFLDHDCLKKTESGEIEYNFGPEARSNLPAQCLLVKKRQRDAVLTPEKKLDDKKVKYDINTSKGCI